MHELQDIHSDFIFLFCVFSLIVQEIQLYWHFLRGRQTILCPVCLQRYWSVTYLRWLEGWLAILLFMVVHLCQG